MIGVQVKGEMHPCDLVVSNADVRSTYSKLLKQKLPKKLERVEPSSSALIFYWGINRSFSELGVHNIFFSSDYKKEFTQIFEKKVLPDEPTVYVNITAKEAKSDAPEGMRELVRNGECALQ